MTIKIESLTSMLKLEAAVTKLWNTLSADAQKVYLTANPGSKFVASKLDLNLKKGALHKDLGVPADKKIPEAKLQKAEHSDNPTVKKRAVLAETMKHWNKK